jgi:hypothetical protein
MTTPPRRPWWENIERCQAVIGKGEKRRWCGNRPLRPYERRPGDLFIPRYCRWHIGQQEKD